MDHLRTRLTELASMAKASTPVVSVYLDTRWSDEHQRDRVRIFLKNELARAREAGVVRAAGADLDWIEEQGAALVDQATGPEAAGVALFACAALGLRERLAVRAPLRDAFVVAEAPYVQPLVAAVEQAAPALVVFVDAESARIIPLTAVGPDGEIRLESEVPGHHRRGGWAQMAQTRYQRHIQEHRDRHFDAVAASLAELMDARGVDRVVLAGEARGVGVFQRSLPAHVAHHVVGTVAGARHEPAAALVERAAALMRDVGAQRRGEAVDAVLTAAAKRATGAAGVRGVVAAFNRGAIHRLYLLEGFRAPGRLCAGCGTLEDGAGWTCRVCGTETSVVEIGETLAERVVATGGAVEAVPAHPALAAAGGIAARLRYPL